MQVACSVMGLMVCKWCMLQQVPVNGQVRQWLHVIVPQDIIHKKHKDTSALWSMCWMNFWCSLYNCVYLFVVTSAGWDLLTFCRAFPEVLLQPDTSPVTEIV